jgi:putative DNA primase/helicase
MSGADIDFASLMEPVARRLLGEPNEKLSKKNELRYGANGSLKILLKEGMFFDFETKEGGGVLTLFGG